MLKNVCRIMDIINEKTQHVTSPIALLSSMYCSKYDSLKYIHFAETLGLHLNDLAIGCCILSKSVQFPSLYTIIILQQWFVSFTKYSIYVIRRLAENEMEEFALSVVKNKSQASRQGFGTHICKRYQFNQNILKVTNKDI